MNNKNFEHSALEADIERLSKEINEKKNLLEHKKVTERELIKQTLQPMIKSNQPVQSIPSGLKIQSQILPDYLASASDEIKFQIEELVDSLFRQGIQKVVKRAQRASPFVLDAFHDALTDKLHEELKKRKLI
ncbi:MAG: hypothetical protein AAB958_00245 [Patescibacteria group bacterium]